MAFNKPAPPKEDKPQGRVISESTAISRFFSFCGRGPKNKEELVAWVKAEYGNDARVS